MAAIPGRHFRLFSPISQGYLHNKNPFAIPNHPRRNAAIRWGCLGNHSGPRVNTQTWVTDSTVDVRRHPYSISTFFTWLSGGHNIFLPTCALSRPLNPRQACPSKFSMAAGNIPGESNALVVQVPCVVFFVVTPCFVAARFWSRHTSNSSVGWDDWCCLVSWVRPWPILRLHILTDGLPLIRSSARLCQVSCLGLVPTDLASTSTIYHQRISS